jgi:hypothetical protein
MAAVIGVALVLVALLLAEFASFPSTGHRINTAKWPSEAQAILKENPGTPITSEQWRRIEQALRPHGGYNTGQVPYWSQTARASWWWFVLVPAAACAFLAATHRKLSAATVAWLSVPSGIALIAAVFLSHAA